MNNKTKQKVLLTILISFFSVIYIVNYSSANYLDDHIGKGTGTDTIFANAACEATLGISDEYFNATANYVAGGYIKPDYSVAAYYKKGQYCIEEVNGSGSGNFYVYNIIDLYPDGSVTVCYGNDDSAMKTIRDSGITRVMKQLAYLSKKSIETGEGRVGLDSYKVAIQSLMGQEKARFINMGIDNRFYYSMGKIDEAEGKYQESLNAANSSTAYRARFMFIGKTGGQGLIIFGAKEIQNGKLEVIKQDQDGKRLSGITFKLSNGDTAITDKNGVATFSNIPLGTYTVQEIAHEDYEVIGSSTQTIEVKTGETAIVTFKNEVKKGGLSLVKKDEGTGKPLANVGFAFQVTDSEYKDGIIKQYVAIDSEGNVSYTDEPTTIKTNEDGEINIKGLWPGTYEVIETEMPYSEYSKKEKMIGNIVVEPGEYPEEVYEVTNKRIYINLSGYAWEDIDEVGKQQSSNQLYQDTQSDINDKRLQNIKVLLKDRKGNIIKEAITDENGEYRFENILIDELENYYIEFTYNGMSYEAVDVNISKANGSKADEGGLRDTFNSEYATIEKNEAQNESGEKTYTLQYDTENYTSELHLGDNLEYGYGISTGASEDELEQYYKNPVNGVYEQYQIHADTINAYKDESNGIEGYLNAIKTAEEIRAEGITEITDLNLGLRKREQPDLAIVKDVYSSKVSIKGEEHTYLYGDRFKTSNEEKYGMEPQVKFGQEVGSETYTRPLYASDIKYTGSNQLEVKVTYQIGIYNQSNTLKVKVNELNDYFDTKYIASLTAGTQINEDGSVIQGIDVTGVETYNDEYYKVTMKPNLEIENQSEAIIYVELTIKPENIIDIVDNGNEVKLDNIVEITSYSTKDAKGNTYAGIDTDSQPENAIPGDTTTYEDDTDKAPGLLLVLQEERTIEGTVFEDVTKLKEKMRQGSGSYNPEEDGDQGIAGIQVEVKKADGTTAQVYKYDSNTHKGEWVEAKGILTDENGNYRVGGFIPDNYYVVFTWGGKEYTLSDGNKKEITVQDYKGTTVDETSYTAKATNDEWYKDSFKKNYEGIEWNSVEGKEIRVSDAIDNYETRKSIDEEIKDITYAKKTAGTLNYTTMDSTTPTFKINLECTKGPANIKDEYETENGILKIENGYVVKKDTYKNTAKSIDFGIAERARQTLSLDKRIQHVKLTLANGVSIIDADIDEQGNIAGKPSYIAYIPEGQGVNGSRAKIRIEIDSEIVQGATLEVIYGLAVTNIGEIDYNNERYYYYGAGHGETEKDMVSLKATQIIDYIGDNATEDINNTQWKFLVEGELNSYKDTLLSNETIEYAKTISKIVTTDELKDKELKPIDGQNLVAVTIASSKLLSNNDEIFLENHAEIIHVEKSGGSSLTTTPGNYVPTDAGTSEVDNSHSEELTVIPPQGTTDNTIYYIILGISSLGILLAGIILIKKYILR